MIKSKLVNELSARLPNFLEKDLGACVNHILEQMSDSLSNNTRIEIRGFGSFSNHYRPPRNAHNPKTGEKVTTKEKYSPHFKAGKELRELVDNARKKEKEK